MSALSDAELITADLANPKYGAENHQGIARNMDLAFAQYDRHAALPDRVVHPNEY